MKISIIILAILTLGAAATLAEMVPMNLGGPETDDGRATFGNELFACWPPIGPGLVVEDGEVQEFMHLVTGLACDPGIEIASVSMAYWAPVDGLYTFDMQPVVRVAVEAQPGCLVPGEVLITASGYSFVEYNMSSATVYYMGIPVDHPHCIEADLDYFVGWRVSNYGLPLEMQMGNCWNGGCENYTSDGAGGWLDIPVDLGYNAQAFIWITYNCCDNPVATTSSSWSTVKLLY